jgi:hypothetical protein
MKHKLRKKIADRAHSVTDRVQGKTEEAAERPPRITNETIAAHREEVLGSARKYIYPLGHSRHRIVKTSVTLFVVLIVVFFAYCVLALYKLQSSSTFVYDVTRVIPFPIAKVGSNYVSYENYLFELRHYVHYYETQQKLNVHDNSGKQQIASYKKQALQQVIDAAYIKQLARQNGVSVSGQEVTDEINLVRAQNRLGSSDQVLADVLHQFWGWNIYDFRRELRQQLLAQKLVAKLDTATTARAQSALDQLRQGGDFGALAGQVSDDVATKANGGQYGFPIDQQNRDIPPQVVDALFKLQKPGDVSITVNTGSTLEIIKLVQINGDKRQAAHISFSLKPISTYLDPLKAKEKTHRYISL